MLGLGSPRGYTARAPPVVEVTDCDYANVSLAMHCALQRYAGFTFAPWVHNAVTASGPGQGLSRAPTWQIDVHCCALVSHISYLLEQHSKRWALSSRAE